MNKQKLFYLITLLPLLDLLTSFQARFFPSVFSIGIITKGLLVLFLIYYIFFKSASKYKRMSIFYIIFLICYGLCYFIFKPDLLSFEYLINEVNYLFKIFYYPIIFLGLLNYFDDYGFNKKIFIKSLLITLYTYTTLLFLPQILNLSFSSYEGNLIGSIGWFYAANEISVILILLFPISYYLIAFKNRWLIFLSLPFIYVISSVGTKVTLFGAIIITILSLISILISQKFKFNKNTFGVICIMLFTFLIFFGLKDVAINNMNSIYEDKNYDFIENNDSALPDDKEENNTINNVKPNKNDKEENKNNNVNGNVNDNINNNVNILEEDTNNFVDEVLRYLLSSRDLYYYRTKQIYHNSYSWDYSLFGMGFSNTPRVNDEGILKLIEIDYLDIYFHTGIIALLLNLMPLIYMVYKVVKYLIFEKTNLKNYCDIFYYSLIVFLGFSIAAIAGHVLFAPSVSFYLALYILFVLYKIDCFTKKEIKKNKIDILALHLNYGGVENVLTTQANMLIDKYDVEIICLYNSQKEVPFKIDKKVKITYLLDTISNREDFKDALRNFKITKIFKEGFKALKILYLKPYLIKKAIVNSDAKIIISTRKEFSKILGNNHRDGVITLGEEHNHHDNNKKYIKDVIKCNKKLDYLLPASKELTVFYENKVKAKVVYIPNSLNYYPKEVNQLNTKKLIAVGRLSKEKGFIDLIDVMKEVGAIDKSIVLDIYGDGAEKNTIFQKIKLEKLEKNINLKGFIPPTELQKNLKNYSLFLLPSYRESFGLAVLEGMSYGIPCVMFDSAKGPLEFVNKDNGIIIKDRNSKRMAKEIINALNDRKKIEKLGQNSRIKSEEYRYEKIKIILNKFVNDINKGV